MIDKIKYFSYNNERKRLIKFFFAQLYKEKWLSGRRRTIGNRVYVISVPWVQIPFSPPKNTAEKDTFSAVFFYPSRRLGISSPHEVWWISSALWAVYHHASACIFLRLDDIQHYVLVIYRNKLRMIYKADALIYLPMCDIMTHRNPEFIEQLSSVLFAVITPLYTPFSRSFVTKSTLVWVFFLL